ncbi:MAG: hypothetical protein OEY20_07115 [Gemmatimonadota bacterium]|nr:hypothetical protein [Gemmatimonadota bacterium]
MLSRARLIFAVGVGLLFPASAAAQGVWVPHQPPCKLSTGYYLVKGSQLHLKLAIESRFEDEKESRINEARSVLYEAILEKGQEGNAAAWYYLGRTYAEGKDFDGADSAFRRAVVLEPACAEDVDGHRARLASFALNDALRTWGAGAADSARTFFRQARALDTTDAEVPLYLSIMFSSAQEPDSAAKYLEFGIQAAKSDTGHAQRLRQAYLEVARGYESRALQHTPAALTVGQTRMARDTTGERIASDSALLDRIVTEVSGVRASGGRLNPQALAAFQRDSALLENRLGTARHALDSLQARAAEDSSATVAALAPALRYFSRFIDDYPKDFEVAIQLLRMQATAGDRAALDALVERVAASADAAPSAVVPAAMSLYGDGLYEDAARLLEGSLAHHPNDHAALGLATHVYYAQRNAERLMSIAQQRLALAPLDDGGARAVALAWDVAGQADSARRWVAMADTGLGWHVRVTQFQTTEHSTSVTGYARNARPQALGPLTLLFEFLDDEGGVAFTSSVTIPALEPGGRAPLSVRVDRGGAASWRYRRE